MTRQSKFASAAIGFAVATVLAAPGHTAPTVPPGMVIPHGTKDIGKTVPGEYTADPNHTGVIVRVSHIGFSMSVFRFDRASATLKWDPKAPEKSALTATVETASLATPVKGFAEQLAGRDYLNAAAFPQATFVSTAFHQTDATHGTVDGKFTLLGKTVPMTFAVTLIGAGPGFAGGPVMGHVIGVHAEATLHPADFGMPAMFDPIEIAIDTEFDHRDAKP